KKDPSGSFIPAATTPHLASATILSSICSHRPGRRRRHDSPHLAGPAMELDLPPLTDLAAAIRLAAEAAAALSAPSSSSAAAAAAATLRDAHAAI
uniref:Uncharacterized protein n=1 Tax=Aegilops tauschii subsp. strangulata TaxID=200361 RepID=A0A453CH69_AEGTS